MPSRPLSADTKAVVMAYTRLYNEAIDVAKGCTEKMPAAVARLVQLVPPARVDLVDEVLVGVGRRDLSATLDWPPGCGRSGVAGRARGELSRLTVDEAHG